jgi:hypothetical protein
MFFRWLSVIAFLTLCACAQGAKPVPPSADDKASARMTPVIEKYKKQQVVTGFDIKGKALVVYTDTEKFSEMDDSSENAMKAELLDRWAGAWKAGHPGHHAKLYVILQNYYGQEMARLQRAV